MPRSRRSEPRTRERRDPDAAPAPSAAAVQRGRPTTHAGPADRDTAVELAVRSALHASGARFRVDAPVRVAGLSRPVRPDVVHGGLRVAVFLDGCWWHGCPAHSRPSGWWVAKLEANAERDRRQTDALVAAGWCVVRAWEHVDPAETARLVAEALKVRRWRQARALPLLGTVTYLGAARNLARMGATA